MNSHLGNLLEPPGAEPPVDAPERGRQTSQIDPLEGQSQGLPFEKEFVGLAK